jgi:hypothetical protein
MTIRKKLEESMPITLVKFLLLFPVFFSSMTLLLIYAESGMMVEASISAFFTWVSYSLIHHLMVGVPIDDRSMEKNIPSSDNEWVLFGAASFLFVGGTALIALGFNSPTNIETFIGVGVVLTGYFIAHYDLGDEIV